MEDSTLKNLEILIGNMEQNQAKQNQEVLRSIETMLDTFKGKPDLEYETDPEIMRILTKSPISTLKSSGPAEDKSTDDVKNFVWQHIQEIVPNLVQQVEQELMEKPEEVAKIEAEQPKEPEPLLEPQPEPTPSVDPAVYIMEEVIKPNLREASIREEVQPSFIYATEIANFKLEFDRGTERWHEAEWESSDLTDVERIVYKCYMAPNEQPKEDVGEVAVESSVNSLPTAKAQEETAPEKPIEAQKIENTEVTQPETVNEELRQQENLETPLVITSETISEAVSQTANESDKQKSNENNLQIKQNVAEVQVQSDDQPSTSREANRRAKRSQQSRKGRSREQSQKPTNRTKLPNNIDQKVNESKTAAKETEAVKDKDLSAAASNIQSDVTASDPKTSTPLKILSEGTDSNTLDLSVPNQNSVETMENVPSTEINDNLTIELISNRSEGVPAIQDLGNTENISEPTANPIEEITSIQDSTTISEQSEDPQEPEKPIEVSQTTKALQVPREEASIEIVSPPNEEQTKSPTSQEVNIQDTSHVTSLPTTDVTPTLETIDIAPSTSSIPKEQKQSPKRLSKIPVRTLSSSSLRSESRSSNRTPTANDEIEREETTSQGVPIGETVSSPKSEQLTDNQEVNLVSQETQSGKDTNIVEEPATQPLGLELEEHSPNATAIVFSPTDSDEVFEDAPEFSGSDGTRPHDETASDAELYSLDSDGQRAETKSPEDEVVILLDEESQMESSIAQSESNASLDSHSSESETSKVVLKEFVPSGDPAKQNLSELVEDTQRLIKQMRDEISMDEFESTDEDEYSDEYSDEYDEGEEEEWYDSEGEEEGDFDGEEGNTYNEHASYIEEASTGDEGTEIEDIMEEDEDLADDDEPLQSQIPLDIEPVISPALSVTPTNQETDTIAHTEVVSSTGTRLETELPNPAMESILPSQSVQEDIKVEALPIQSPPPIADSETRPAEQPVELVLEIPSEVEPTPVEVDPVEEPTALPITPAPPIVDSESRPVELPVETVLEEPKKVTPSMKGKTANSGTASKGPSTSSSTKTNKSTVSKIPKPTNEPTNKSNSTPLNKKVPLRSKSFSAPMGISSVKRIQEVYLQKQSSSIATSRVPLKSSPVTKKSINDAISRFNSNQADGPSTSGAAAAAAAALLKPRSQPRIPKKKYHETCFSDDDYETSTTEEEQEEPNLAEPQKAEQLKRKMSMPVFRAYPSVQEPVIEDPAVCTSQVFS